jgi:methylglutamate dehydrogenase subunit D
MTPKERVCVANLSLSSRSALAPYWHSGRHGRADGQAGVTLKEVTQFALAEITPFRGQKNVLAERMAQSFGLTLPAANKTTQGQGLRLVSIGPGKYLVLAEADAARGLVSTLETQLGGVAAVVDQSDARAIIEVSGPRARDALAKGIMIDLDPSAFHTGDAATTFAVQLWLTLWQETGEPSYRLSVFRAFGADLLHWLIASGQEFGCDLAD